MPYINVDQSGDVNLCAFLDMIAWSEGTDATVHPLTRMDGYDVIVTGSSGPEIFYDFSTHPFGNDRAPKHVTGSLYSSASGRYQFLRTHWVHYRDQLNLTNFGPLSQDLWAIQLIRERSALTDIRQHRNREAISRCANIWVPDENIPAPSESIDILTELRVLKNETMKIRCLLEAHLGLAEMK
ncbi:TPA: glycoside hydrolase family 104 protein [Enterobacter cancerogenus]|nr:glycoside hydrolase family 104 protein [Enterobacter cancerogenus]